MKALLLFRGKYDKTSTVADSFVDVSIAWYNGERGKLEIGTSQGMWIEASMPQKSAEAIALALAQGNDYLDLRKYGFIFCVG